MLSELSTISSQSYFSTIFVGKYDNMHFSNEQLTNLITKIVKRVLSKGSFFYRNDTILGNIVKEEFGEEKFIVMHEKGSYKKYGDATETDLSHGWIVVNNIADTENRLSRLKNVLAVAVL